MFRKTSSWHVQHRMVKAEPLKKRKPFFFYIKRPVPVYKPAPVIVRVVSKPGIIICF